LTKQIEEIFGKRARGIVRSQKVEGISGKEKISTNENGPKARWLVWQQHDGAPTQHKRENRKIHLNLALEEVFSWASRAILDSIITGGDRPRTCLHAWLRQAHNMIVVGAGQLTGRTVQGLRCDLTISPNNNM
jgi:hypothetical protein